MFLRRQRMSKYIYSMIGFFSVLFSSQAFADDSSPAKQGGFPQTLVILGMALVFFYFILWRPEQKRRKLVEKQRSSMKSGDRVTAMGIIGTLVKVEDKTVVLKMIDGSKIEMLKTCITDVQDSSAEVTVEDTSSK